MKFLIILVILAYVFDQNHCKELAIMSSYLSEYSGMLQNLRFLAHYLNSYQQFNLVFCYPYVLIHVYFPFDDSIPH